MMTHTLTLTAEHLAVIDRALQEMPLRLAYPVVAEINRQIDAAQATPADHQPDLERP